jgi:hypothetical protein
MYRRSEWFWVALGLLFIVSWHPPVTASVIWKPHTTDQTDMLDLLRFVLLNDNEWKKVLQQHVKKDMIQISAYHDTDVIKAELHLVDENEELIEAGPILKKVLDEYSWLGTYVEFASRTLSIAFMCYTYTNILLVVEMMLIMEFKYQDEKEKYPKGIQETRKEILMDTLSAYVMLVDKLAAVHGRLDLMGEVLYLYDESIYSNRNAHMLVMHSMSVSISEQISRMCKQPKREQVFFNLGFTRVKGELNSSSTKLTHVASAIKQVIHRIIYIYGNFKIQSMQLNTWKQILNYQHPVNQDIDPFIIKENLPYDGTLIHILRKGKTTQDSNSKNAPFEMVAEEIKRERRKKKEERRKENINNKDK